jgi:hypothetical protein
MKGATQRDVRLAERAALQHGVISKRQLRALGFGDSAVDARIRNGRLHRLHRGVYAVGHTALTLDARFLAAVLACGPGAALSHFATLALFDAFAWDDRDPEVTVPGARRRHDGLRVHRTRTLDAADLTRHHGVRTTTVARALLDVAPRTSDRALDRLTRRAQAKQRTSVVHVAAVLARHHGRLGTPRLARVIAHGPAPTRSELEDVVLDLIRAANFVPPIVNGPLHLDGRRVIPDFRWPAQRLIVEADGAAWHEGRLAREDDEERQRLLEAHGHRVVRVTWDRALLATAQTQARIALAGAPRAA